jgi:hypothetical protein
MFRKELPVSEAAEDISSSSGVSLDYPLLGSLSAMDVLHHLISKGTELHESIDFTHFSSFFRT